MARRLESPPSSLALFGRAALGALPGTGKLPFVSGGGGDVPELELELVDVEVDQGKLAEYARVCGFGVRDTLPATYPHVLAFPLHLALMTDSSFPVPAVGLVHIQNRIVQKRPIDLGERLTIRVRATQFDAHPKGRSFSLLTDVSAGGEPVWEGVSTNLRRGKGGEPAAKSGHRPAPALTDEAEWRLSGDLGRRYAGVSGDRNPIHMYGLTAKAFGFPRQIVHGMWTKARSLAQLGPRVPDAYSVDVAFKRPILLPGKVKFASGGGDDDGGGGGGALDFAVRSARDDSPHLTGNITPR